MRVLLTLVAIAVSAGAQTTVINGAGGGGATPAGTTDGTVQIKVGTSLGAAAIQAATAAELAGVELVTNGTFASGLSGWTVSGDGTGWSIVGGKLHHTPGIDNKISAPVTLITSDVYAVTVQVDSQTVGTAYANLGVDCNSDCTNAFDTGANRRSVTAWSDSGVSVVEIQPSSDSDITISSLGLLHPINTFYLQGLPNTSLAIGSGTLSASTSGHQNTGIGPGALANTTSGSVNAAVGYGALGANTTGGFNTAIGGWSPLGNNLTGFDNIAVGALTLFNNLSGSSNVAVGDSALNQTVTGSSNTAVGYSALSNLGGTSSNNIGIGDNALTEATASSNLIGIVSGETYGVQAMRGSQKDAINSALVGPQCVTGTNSNQGTPFSNVFAFGGIATQDNENVVGNPASTQTVLYGGTQIISNTSQPTCAVSVRGMFWVTQGATGVKDSVQVCAKDVANAYAWRTLY